LHIGVVEDSSCLVCEAVLTGGYTHVLEECGVSICRVLDCLLLKVEGKYSPEMSVTVHCSTWCNNPEAFDHQYTSSIQSFRGKKRISHELHVSMALLKVAATTI
jgi:hypothetical protein